MLRLGNFSVLTQNPVRLSARRTLTPAQRVVRSDVPVVVAATLGVVALQFFAHTAEQRLLVAVVGVLAFAGPGLTLRGLGELRQDND